MNQIPLLEPVTSGYNVIQHDLEIDQGGPVHSKILILTPISHGLGQ